METERQEKMSVDESRKCKHVLEGMKKRRKQVEMDMEHLENSADSLCEKAESTGALKFVAEANACRGKAKEKGTYFLN